MKRLVIGIGFILVSFAAATAQTLNVQMDNVIYRFPASQTGDMTFFGDSLTVMGKDFFLSEITSMYTDTTSVTDFRVEVIFDTDGAQVTIPGNVAEYIDASINGNHVTLVQSDSYSGTDHNQVSDEITYQLSGTATDGSLTLGGSYKCTIALAGLALTNPSGAAITVTNSKRIQLSAKKGTTNSITDGSGSQKACIYSKGQLQLQGNGTLNVVGNYKHGIKSASYIFIKNLTLNITSTVGDGISCEEYFRMISGSVTLSGIGDDGIQCDLGGSESTGETTGHEDEDTGNIYLEGGDLSVTTTSTATKCIKSDGSITVSGGTYTLNAQGGIDTSDTSDLSYSTGFKADGDFTQSGGEITINVSGASGRGIGIDGTFSTTTDNTGTLTITNSGKLSSSGSSYFATAKGIKAGVVAINGGTVDITMTSTAQASKGIKSDSGDGSGDMTITGGSITISNGGAGGYDGVEKDAKGAGCLKSDNKMVISGGNLTLKATGTGGKCIKADGALTVSGGSIGATSSGSQYKYSNNVTASAKAIKSSGAMTVTDGTIVASSSSHEGIETKSTLEVSGGYIYVAASDDAINSASKFKVSGGYIFANSSGNDGLDANGDMTISGGNIVAVSSNGAEVGIDVIENGTLTITGGNIVAVGGLENTKNVSGTCYQASSYTKGEWYGLYNGSSLAFAFKVPSNSKMGSPMVAYTTGTTSLKSGVTGSGASFWNGYGYSSCSGGSTVSLSTYTNEGMGGGGNPGGGGGKK